MLVGLQEVCCCAAASLKLYFQRKAHVDHDSFTPALQSLPLSLSLPVPCRGTPMAHIASPRYQPPPRWGWGPQTPPAAPAAALQQPWGMPCVLGPGGGASRKKRLSGGTLRAAGEGGCAGAVVGTRFGRPAGRGKAQQGRAGGAQAASDFSHTFAILAASQRRAIMITEWSCRCEQLAHEAAG
jgi:hypothetical protein